MQNIFYRIIFLDTRYTWEYQMYLMSKKVILQKLAQNL